MSYEVKRSGALTEYLQDGKQHRTDGPAVECVSGDKAWYVDGSELTEVEFNDYLFGNRFDDAMAVI